MKKWVGLLMALVAVISADAETYRADVTDDATTHFYS